MARRKEPIILDANVDQLLAGADDAKSDAISDVICLTSLGYSYSLRRANGYTFGMLMWSSGEESLTWSIFSFFAGDRMNNSLKADKYCAEMVNSLALHA